MEYEGSRYWFRDEKHEKILIADFHVSGLLMA
jgi:hypothetical protein